MTVVPSSAPVDDDPHLLLLRSGQGQVSLKINSITYIESQGKKQEIHVEGKKDPYVLRSTFRTFEESPEEEGFLPVYKGILVNCRFIRVIEEESVLLKDGTNLPLPRRKTEEAKERYMELRKKELAIAF